jgi:hypothetical protein
LNGSGVIVIVGVLFFVLASGVAVHNGVLADGGLLVHDPAVDDDSAGHLLSLGLRTEAHHRVGGGIDYRQRSEADVRP